jgi:hypothetical protein
VNATDILRSVFAPLLEVTILVPMAMFWALLGLGIWGGPIGVFLLFLTIPPLFRFLSFIVESYANGQVPAAFDAEFFNWIGTMWTLFPLLLAMLLATLGFYATQAWGSIGTWLIVILGAGVVPPSLAVLAITHSSAQALNPLAMLRVYDRAGPQFLIAPLYALVLAWTTIEVGPLPVWARILMSLFTLFSLAALSGALIAPLKLVRDVYIPDEVAPDEDRIAGDVERARAAALGHAYGFISRDNREGGFGHLFDEIEKDPDPAAAWDWYFRRMLGWEQKAHALFFAQHYVRDALRHDEEKVALKVALRCIFEDQQFRPFREDIPALVDAAERLGNAEIAEVLKRA